jgi:2-amino-4-hydroxy-6-hydroxymethyldihydropteridine diphosphokinase
MRDETVYIGIGSNIGERLSNCRKAIEFLKGIEGFEFMKASSFYLTEPVGLKEQRWFVNGVVMGKTTIPPLTLLSIVKGYEARCGRRDGERWGPRIIDIDILLFGERIIEEEELKIPHPELHKRAFVLIPLCEISPDAYHPVIGKRAIEILKESEDRSIVIPFP